MNTTIKTILTGACVTIACLMLAACGGGNESGDAGNGGGTASNGGSTENGSPAYRIADQFVTHMANREFAEAQSLTTSGGGATVLEEYVQALDQASGAPNSAMLYDLIFSMVSDRFSDASLEVTDETDDSANVRVNLDGETFDVVAKALDGETWALEIPNEMLVPFIDLVGAAAAQQRDGNVPAMPSNP